MGERGCQNHTGAKMFPNEEDPLLGMRNTDACLDRVGKEGSCQLRFMSARQTGQSRQMNQPKSEVKKMINMTSM